MSIFEGMRRDKPSHFDVHYGLASAAITLGGVTIATTAAAYHGISVLATSAGATVRVYDSTDSSGKLLDIFKVLADVSTRHDNFIPVQARLGIHVNMTLATAASGVVFFAPRG